jgi:energy-coupling factor transporter ATP-binding protein EcfA2
MSPADYRGARGANAGADFHELWALRHALALLAPESDLTAVALEGLRQEDETGTSPDTWDGVDCTFYFGGTTAASANRVSIDQLKYSGANPEVTWSVSRLTHSSNKRRDNSVIGRLAKAFLGIRTTRPTVVLENRLRLRLVSNQPVAEDVLAALAALQAVSTSNPSSEALAARDALMKASGLKRDHFEEFVRLLDFSECGRESRFAIEERALATIAAWTEDDARATLNDLMRFVRRAMMPEGKGELITRESILSWLGFSDPGALLPCPSLLDRIANPIPRDVSHEIVTRMTRGEQRICMHGPAGCGKTTSLQEIAALLPPGSELIVFDCYGKGRYLDADALRHRTRDAFLQLSNELATRLRLPLLLTRDVTADYPRAFKKRLARGSEALAARSSTALLIIAIDAADNSVIAAENHSPKERSFVLDFVSLGDLPSNVRLLVTSRTGRLKSLRLPSTFQQVTIAGFSRHETEAHIRRVWSAPPELWLDDFHYLSGGNPRVQKYALEFAGDAPDRALNYLRPSGKDLNNVFREQLSHAVRKAGAQELVQAFCAGLALLPRPIPVDYLAAVTRVESTQIVDFCSDLSPGLRLFNGEVSFTDEDFEHFVRTEATTQLAEMTTRVADRLFDRRRQNAYAATHVAGALLSAGRSQDIIELVGEESDLRIIRDPVLRRDVQLRRLTIAMKVCRDTGNNVDAVLTLLRGAEALKTDAAIRQALIENPDLAAAFARDSLARTVLRNADDIEHHGRLLFHFLAADSRNGDGISVREGRRQLTAWLHRREQQRDDARNRHNGPGSQAWPIEDEDIAAQTEAALRIEGPEEAIRTLNRWRPRSVALAVGLSLVPRLIASGDAAFVRRLLDEGAVTTPWDLLLLTPLGLAGEAVETGRLEEALGKLLRRRLIRPTALRNSSESGALTSFLETILTACEMTLARGGNQEFVASVLRAFEVDELRREDRIFTSQADAIDIALRAHALLQRLSEREPTLATLLITPPEPEGLPEKELARLKRTNQEKSQELREFIGPLIDLYDARAQIILGSIAPREADDRLRVAVERCGRDDYRISRQYWVAPMKARAALAIARLLCVPAIEANVIWTHARSVIRPSADTMGPGELRLWVALALRGELHAQLLGAVAQKSTAVRSARISSSEKVRTLAELATFVLPVSRDDASALFTDVTGAAAEVDADAVHRLSLFAPLSHRAGTAMTSNERRSLCRDFAVLTEDTAVRLKGHDGFPWGDVGKVLTTLDVGLALAAVGRWDDSDLVARSALLPSVLTAGLTSGSLSAAQAAAMLVLLDRPRPQLYRLILDASLQAGSAPAANLRLANELARQELLLRSGDHLPEIADALLLFANGHDTGGYVEELARTSAFFRENLASHSADLSDTEPHVDWLADDNVSTTDPLDSVNWSDHRFNTPEQIARVVESVLTVSRSGRHYVSVEDIFARIRSVVAIGDRASHLKALSSCASREIDTYHVAEAIAACVGEWRGSPAVEAWCSGNLLDTLVNLLPGFSRFISYGQSSLPQMLQASGATHEEIWADLLAAIERHVDQLSAPTIYSLVQTAAPFCRPNDAAQVAIRYARRLVQQIPDADRSDWVLTDIPSGGAAAVARLMFALLADVDVRLRWRAAHALRILARLGDHTVFCEIGALYDRRLERSYRDPNEPFYWLSARLWLAIALDRIASEAPSSITQLVPRLIAIAQDQELPHVLLREFAKSAARKLGGSGRARMSTTTQRALDKSNTTQLLRRAKGTASRFKPYGTRSVAQRFHFDSIDTLPYWYNRALEVFADVTEGEFLELAERWIVDKWGIQSEVWRWDKQPRRVQADDYAHLHSHGSRPTLERFDTYLEWHAMWCAVGELLRSRALAQNDDEGPIFERWLRRESLTLPPAWLADLRTPKPLEVRLWVAPSNPDEWVSEVGDDEFLAELFSNGQLVVAAGFETRSRRFVESVRVATALVSPRTAAALVRALQTVPDSYDYKIPAADDDLEILVPPYELVGWLTDKGEETGIDEQDVFAHGIRSTVVAPSPPVTNMLNLGPEVQGLWYGRTGTAALRYYTWADEPGDERNNQLRYDERIRSSGWRLTIDRIALRELLKKAAADLIVEVEVTRRNKGYEPRFDEEEERKEERFDRVFLLRRDGSFEAAEGHLGTWFSPRPGAGV